MLEQHLVILLLKLAAAASIASILIRFGWFQRMVMREERTLAQRLQLTAGFALVFAASVATRVVAPEYKAVSLGLEGCLLAGLLAGYVTGLLGGVLISLPAMFAGELLTMPLFAGVGVMGGLLRDLAPHPDEIWRVSPFLDMSLSRLLHRRQDWRRTLYHLLVLSAIAMTEVLRQTLAYLFGERTIFRLIPLDLPPDVPTTVALLLADALAVILPLSIWNHRRTEKKLELQERLTTEARLAALTSQINPHFLFNTLNSVSSLIRINPDQARTVVYKLSNILRRLLRKHENLSPLREELSFIDDYLAIEMVRFGDKLKFEKEVDPATLDHLVPSMMLQPLVENSIKHGLSNQVDGGMIRVRSRLVDGRLHVVVEDNGSGIPESKLATLFEQGIGVSNVNERLKVLFGGDYRMWIDSKPGEGTCTQIEIPDLRPSLAAAS